MKNIRSFIFLFVIFLTSCSQKPQTDFSHAVADKRDLDTRTREYITPVRIVWQSDTTNSSIQNIQKLLKQSNGQADLVGLDLCLLKKKNNERVAFVLDFGKEMQGGIEIITGMFEGKDPIHIQVTLGESVSEAMSSTTGSTATNDHAMRDFTLALPWLGRIDIGNSGFRFAKIELLDKRELKLKEVRAVSVYRDIPYLGSFRSNDTLLNKIWQTGAYTVHLNMQEYLWDGIKRDRLVWVGDMYSEVMTILSVFGYNEVVPKSLDLIKEITVLPEWMNGISSYSMWWILIQYKWYLNTGNLAYLQKNKDYIFQLLDLLQTKIDAEGREILDGNRFLDWPTSPNSEAVHAGLQSMMVMCFQTGIKLSDILGEPKKGEIYKKTLALLQKQKPDPNKSKSAGALLVLSGMSDPVTVNKELLTVDPYEGISSYYGFFVLEARAQAGDYQGSLDLIRKYWGGMIDLGATTFWEDFDLQWMKNAGRIDEITPKGKVDVHATYGNYCYKGLRNSLCHGWASGPTTWLTEHVLGVQVLEPGCTKVKIEPHLGDLLWAEGTFPTPYGVIHIRHEKNADGSIRSTIKAPHGVTVVK